MVPVQPLAQTHENWFTSSTHVPPFRHGKDPHSLMSEGKDRKEGYTRLLCLTVADIQGHMKLNIFDKDTNMTSHILYVLNVLESD